ncbi:MAG TPA: hypothetical protein VNO21_03890, partial [Polyangiaceae bacterium]|nr:hypothetical protein [Polyangiaceae bacterium]
GATLCLFLSITLMRDVTEALVPSYGADCPVAVVHKASCPDQRIVLGTLGDIREKVRAAGIKSQSMIVVGRVLTAEHFANSKLYDPEFSHRFRRATGGAPLAAPDLKLGGAPLAVPDLKSGGARLAASDARPSGKDGPSAIAPSAPGFGSAALGKGQLAAPILPPAAGRSGVRPSTHASASSASASAAKSAQPAPAPTGRYGIFE